MTKREIEILERVFSAEVESAFNGQPHIVQTRSKLAAKLADEGYLHWREIRLGGRFPITIAGYELTELGRLTYCYCASERCADEEAGESVR